MLTVVTGWSPAGYLEYGRRFADTFAKYWPKDVNLVVYGEERCELPRGEFRTLDQIPGCMEFLLRHDNRPARGEVPGIGFENRWKVKHYASGYNFRFDARKFSRQGFIPWHAAHRLVASEQAGYLCWLDGDVVTHRKVPPRFLENLTDFDVSFLGRGDKHSEIGFQLYKLPEAPASHPNTLDFLAEFMRMYVSDEVFGLREWHSAYVWDYVRRQFPAWMFKDLTPGGHGHVWQQSPLRVYTEHYKGKRKSEIK